MSSGRGVLLILLLGLYRASVAYEVNFAAALISDNHAAKENATFLAQVSVDDEVLLRFENDSLSTVGLGEAFVVNQKAFLDLVAGSRAAHVVGSSFTCTVIGQAFACSISVVSDGLELATVLANEDRLVFLWQLENVTVDFLYNDTGYDVEELNRTLHLWTGKYDERLNVCGLSGFTVRTSVRGSNSGTNLSCIVHSACVPSAIFFRVGEKTHVPPCVQIGFKPDPMHSCGMTIRETRIRNASCEIWMGLGHVRNWPFEPDKTSFGRFRRSLDSVSSPTTPSVPLATPSTERGTDSLPSTTIVTTTDPNKAELYRQIKAMGGLIVCIVVFAVAFMLCRNGLPCGKKKDERSSESVVSLAARRAAYVGGAVLE